MSLRALGLALGYPVSSLLDISSRVDVLYKPGPPQIKADGSIRETLCARRPLREVQERIYSRILKRFYFPDYLTGSLPGRSQRKNAEQHAGAALLLTADIRKFFPSTSPEVVLSIFRDLAGFSGNVSDCLTKLVTRDSGLPQGACTSPALANLALWSVEPALVAKLKRDGFVYTRFIDDISISSRERVPREVKAELVAQVFGMLGRLGYRPHRGKLCIFSSGRRMVTTKLTTNRKPGLAAQSRAQVRAAVHEQELASSRTLRSSLPSVRGRVQRLHSFHSGKGAALKRRLQLLEAKKGGPPVNDE